MTENNYNNNLKKERIKRDLSQQEMADLLGLSQQSFWRYENKNLNLKKALKFSKLLNVDLINYETTKDDRADKFDKFQNFVLCELGKLSSKVNNTRYEEELADLYGRFHKLK